MDFLSDRLLGVVESLPDMFILFRSEWSTASSGFNEIDCSWARTGTGACASRASRNMIDAPHQVEHIDMYVERANPKRSYRHLTFPRR